MFSKLAIGIMAMLLVGCAIEEAGIEETEIESAIESGARCPIFGCGTNSPRAGAGLVFDELNAYGLPSHAGVQITGARLGGGVTAVTLKVDGDRLYAIDVLVPSRAYVDDALLGMIIQLKNDLGVTVELMILQFAAGSREHIPTYQIMARLAGQSQFTVYVCNDDPLNLDPRGREISSGRTPARSASTCLACGRASTSRASASEPSRGARS